MKPPSRPLTPPPLNTSLLYTRLMNLLPRTCRAGLPRVLMLKQQILQCLPADICMNKCMRACVYVCMYPDVYCSCVFVCDCTCLCLCVCGWVRARMFQMLFNFTQRMCKSTWWWWWYKPTPSDHHYKSGPFTQKGRSCNVPQFLLFFLLLLMMMMMLFDFPAPQLIRDSNIFLLLGIVQ